MAFRLLANVKLSNVSVSAALSYLEFLVENDVSVNMINNHISAIRAMSIVFDLYYGSWEHPKIENFNDLNVAFISYKLTMWDSMRFSDGHKASWPTSKKNRHL